MSRRLRLLLWIMITALTLLLGLQAYLSISDYQHQAMVLRDEVTAGLRQAIETEKEARLDSLTDRYMAFLFDTAFL
ncbi:MAG: hypothetical protein KDC54_02940, partial [Lewinella sp.]|nr:hypothetical protein [Lewinella sp.]